MCNCLVWKCLLMFCISRPTCILIWSPLLLFPYRVQLQHSEESRHFWRMLVYFAVSTIHQILICTMQSTRVCDLFSCVYTRGASVYSLIQRTFVESAQYFTLAKSQGGYKAKHVTVTHPFGGHPGLCLTLAFEHKHSCSMPLTPVSFF